MMIEAKPAVNSDGIESLPGYEESRLTPEADMCIVLYGYGRPGVLPTTKYGVDGYEFIGGIGRNIPRSVANHWKNGTRPDGKPAYSRIYPQAILPNNADEYMITRAVKGEVVAPEKLAAMINQTDAGKLFDALGRAQSVALAEKLLQRGAPTPKEQK